MDILPFFEEFAEQIFRRFWYILQIPSRTIMFFFLPFLMEVLTCIGTKANLGNYRVFFTV